MGTFKGWVQVLVAVAVIAGFTVTVQKGYYVLTPDLSEATTVLREHRGKCASSHCMNTLRAAERGIRSQRWYIVCVAACAGYLIFFLGCSCYLKRRDLVETRQELSGALAAELGPAWRGSGRRLGSARGSPCCPYAKGHVGHHGLRSLGGCGSSVGRLGASG